MYVNHFGFFVGFRVFFNGRFIWSKCDINKKTIFVFDHTTDIYPYTYIRRVELTGKQLPFYVRSHYIFVVMCSHYRHAFRATLCALGYIINRGINWNQHNNVVMCITAYLPWKVVVKISTAISTTLFIAFIHNNNWCNFCYLLTILTSKIMVAPSNLYLDTVWVCFKVANCIAFAIDGLRLVCDICDYFGTIADV